MEFVVNQDKKREWGKLWWRDCPQGRVLLYVSLVSMVLLAVALAHLFLTVDFGLALADPWTPGLDLEVRGNEGASLMIHILVVSLFFVLSCLVFSALRIRRDCLGAVTDEKLLIEGGVLTYSFHDGADAAKTSRWVVCARARGLPLELGPQAPRGRGDGGRGGGPAREAPRAVVQGAAVLWGDGANRRAALRPRVRP